MDKDLSYKTVFIQNIPHTCSNEELQEVYSVVGPIKEAFVVQPKNIDDYIKERKSLVGYVKYHSREDAQRAVNFKRPFFIEGKRTKVTFAKKKITKKRKKGSAITSFEDEVMNEQQNTADIIADFGFEIVPVHKESVEEVDTMSHNLTSTENSMEAEDMKQKKSGAASPKTFTVCISGFPYSYTIEDFAELWKIKEFDIPENFSIISSGNKSAKGQALVEMNRKQSALKVLTHMNGLTFGDITFKATLKLDPNSEAFRKDARRSRMIVRNLSFKCTEKDLRNAFEKHGTVTEVIIPEKGGRKAGYAFVQLSHIFESMKAVKEVNMTEIKGRKVAVDLCLPQKQYIAHVKAKKSEATDGELEKESNPDKISDDEANFGVEDESGIESNEDDESSEGDDDSAQSETDEDEESGRSDSELEDSDSEEVKKKIAKKKHATSSFDVHEGRTVFMRNLSFDVTEKELENELKKFGTLKYCKLVMNPETGFSKGTAFAQFETKEMAEDCVNTIENPGTAMVLHDRRVISSIAQSREGIKTFLKEKKEEAKEKDTRNAYLANEGFVRPGTLAAVGVSEVELKKRVRIEMAKRHKLKNPNVFVSTTRLCCHNVPRGVNDTKLKLIIKNALKEIKGVKITECRVMRDRRKVNEDGVARSLGYAFVAFTKHEHALLALRALNNNPEIFTAEKRPIVEFSLEDKRALQIQAQRRQRQLARNELHEKLKSAKKEDSKPKNKKQLRIDRLREERRATRQLKAGFLPSLIKSKKGQGTPSTVKITAKAISTADKERKDFVGASSVTAGGKKVPLSKQLGPKIRKRDKSKVLDRLKESKKLNKSKKW